ncbi:unannotated protein [freshwater metagenome]|uniref:Unannotated protein n=1 Tax=freshwater metagenome TaxID=449393 RepID=A0A6J7GPS0_9ZZZZ
MEDVTKQIAESGATAAEHIRVVSTAGVLRTAATKWVAAHATASEQGACLVVFLALIRIGQHVVRLGHGLETLFSRGIARILIRVELTGERAVLLLDRIRVGVLRDTEDGVEVLLQPVFVHDPSATPTRAGRSTRPAYR